MRKLFFLPRLSLGLSLGLLLTAVPQAVRADWFSDEEPIMGTRVAVELWAEDASTAQAAMAAVMQEMRRIEDLMSPYIESSELSRMNREAVAQPVAISREMAELLEKSYQISELTDGAFDITYASAGRFYDYREGQRPTTQALEEAIKAIDYHYVQLKAGSARNPPSVRYLHKGVYVDLGGIAKGYAVDRCIDLLESRGFEEVMVSAGGDSRILGDRRGKPWTVGVKDPRNEEKMAAILPLENTAVSTSGDYERYFERDGVRYHHILNPSTGDSAREVRSVTILGPQATFTDALSTSVFVLGVEKGLQLVNRLPGIDAIIVDNRGKLHFSADLLQMGN